MNNRIHYKEIKINVSIIRNLLQKQFLELSFKDISLLDYGWDNENYRLGKEYVIRLPRRDIANKLLLNEIRYLPLINEQLPISIPVPIKIGKPDKYYPWNWSILPYFEGNTANIENISELEVFRLVEFLKQLHRVKLDVYPQNRFRNVPLKIKNDEIEYRISYISEQSAIRINNKIKELWYEVVNESNNDFALIHGDLHILNIIVSKGRINAVIDWGDITYGDPATDLASILMLTNNYDIFKNAMDIYGANESMIKRAIGWGIFFGITFLWTGINSDTKYYDIGENLINNLSIYFI